MGQSLCRDKLIGVVYTRDLILRLGSYVNRYTLLNVKTWPFRACAVLLRLGHWTETPSFSTEQLNGHASTQ